MSETRPVVEFIEDIKDQQNATFVNGSVELIWQDQLGPVSALRMS